MNWKEKWRYIYRWSVVLVGFLAVFWGIWYLVAGKVPEFNTLRIENFSGVEIWRLNLPWGISRWWDLLVIPIWPVAYTLIYCSKKVSKIEDSGILSWGFSPLSIWSTIIPIGGTVIGGICLNIWATGGYLAALYSTIPFWVAIAAISESITYKAIEYPTRLFPDLLTNVNGAIGSLLGNLLTGLTIGLALIFTIGLVPGLVIGLISFLIITLIQYTFIKFARLVYYFFEVIGCWLNIGGDC